MITFKQYSDIISKISKKLDVTKDIATAALVKAQQKGIDPIKWQKYITILNTFVKIMIKAEHEPVDEARFQKITIKDKSGKSHTHGAVRLRPGDTHVAIKHYDALPATNLAPAVKAHTDLSFGSMDKLIKVINHAKRKFGLKKVEIQKIDKKHLEKEERDYKDEYKKFQSSKKMKTYRVELNRYNRKKGTYGNKDKKDASHKNGKIVGFEDESANRGRAEKSRLKEREK